MEAAKSQGSSALAAAERDYANQFVWPVGRQLAVFDAVGGEPFEELEDGTGHYPVLWRCRDCGTIDCKPPARMQSDASWRECQVCDRARIYNDPARVAGTFRTRGLDLVSAYTGDRDETLDARCMRCSEARRISMRQLTSGVLPCLSCDGQLPDPHAPHRVYLFHYPQLNAYKIGITHSRNDARLGQHVANGGVLISVVPTPDRPTALLIERSVLDRYRGFPARVASADFPFGGWTECWSEQAGYPDLWDAIRSHSDLYPDGLPSPT